MSPSKAKRPTWQPDEAAVDAVVAGTHGDPFAVLGMHGGDGKAVSVRVFCPGADGVEVIDCADGSSVATLTRMRPEGFFAGPAGGRRKAFAYRLRLSRGGDTWEAEDPYRFPLILGEMDIYLIGEGSHRRLFERLGAHPMTVEGVDGVAFAVWAPNASRVSVVGDFNQWDGRRHPMRKRVEAGIWELFIPGVTKGTIYKFELIAADGRLLPLKADPFGFAHELPPATGSRVHGLPRYEWSDHDWMANRKTQQALDAPVSIYEVHLGSWRRKDGNATLTYGELGDQLVSYARDMGFTHIECMPVSEHPFSGSWGYQPIGLFAPTSRFGSPEDFAGFVDKAHQAGLGVIIDWVPAHFPSDVHGLARFDGTALYEHDDPRLGFHRDWNTLIYNFGRTEVRNILISNALFWVDYFHIDGLRVDAVASMLYLDYSRNPGEWIPNVHGGRENLEAVSFLREMNTRVFGDYPGATTIAEESTAWPQVSRPVDTGGLGFGYKWNMGWMHDTLDYMSHETVHRKYHHHEMTFGIHYGFTENFVLPLSHDEVVHGKGSLFGRMPGDRWQQFANLRAYFAFMWTHPGKKLLFMGGEFAQEAEWNHDQSLDWYILEYADHRGVQQLVRDLNHLYRELPALHVKDSERSGFDWLDWQDADDSIFAFVRYGRDGDPPVVVVSNMTPIVREDYRLGVPEAGWWRERLNTDSGVYGGSNIGNAGGVQSEAIESHGHPASVLLRLPPLATVVFERAT